jgi:guanine nucleotide-binding protein G(i) subunit alpha
VPLNQYFPKYTGGTDADKAAEFILTQFAGLNNLGLSIFVSMTEVSSVASIRFLMNAVSDTAFENMLRDAGLL